MTIINSNLNRQLLVMQSLQRLSAALDRAETEPYGDSIAYSSDMFVRVSKEESEKTVDKLQPSGDIPRVSEELYEPSSTIFDESSNSILQNKEPEKEASKDTYIPSIGSDTCIGKFLIVKSNLVYAVIKNYHHVVIIDYSCTSLLYPTLVVESMRSYSSDTAAKLSEAPSYGEDIQTTMFISNITYPTTVAYVGYNIPTESIESSAFATAASYPTTVGYKSHTYTESIEATVTLTAASYPTTVAYITKDLGYESIESSGVIYGLSFS